MEDVERLGDLLGWDALTRMGVAGDLREAVVEAEAEIARRGLQERYAEAVIDMLYEGVYLGYSSIDGAPGGELAFALLTAPSYVRVKAMLEVLAAHT
jgi:hypothetical protein